MELQEFISESLKQICFGIRDAQNEVSEDKNCPVMPGFTNDKEEVLFNIVVKIDSSNLSSKNEAKIKVIDSDLKKEKSNKVENAHKINFKIPLLKNEPKVEVDSSVARLAIKSLIKKLDLDSIKEIEQEITTQSKNLTSIKS